MLRPSPQLQSQLVYQELRGVVAQKLANEMPDHTVQPTSLIHKAYRITFHVFSRVHKNVPAQSYD